ncbi:MAG TPA: hypothetical protein VJR89_10775 [Polyangiales bacterium]|nr:hypothetical protein [Polyangiales bacterium]
MHRISLRLRSLRDIDGVLGSFMIGERGELLGRDVTAACGSDVLMLVSSRMQQLCDAFVSADIGGAFESTTLCFPQYKLQVRAIGSAFLVAVLSAQVNLPALRMAMNMLGRQLLLELEAMASFPPEESGEMRRPSAPPPPPPAAGRVSSPPPLLSGPTVEIPPPRSYRGRRITG